MKFAVAAIASVLGAHMVGAADHGDHLRGGLVDPPMQAVPGGSVINSEDGPREGAGFVLGEVHSSRKSPMAPLSERIKKNDDEVFVTNDASVAEKNVDPLEEEIKYDITITDCELDAEAAMTGEGGNTLKEGLIAAEHTVTTKILSNTFPRENSVTIDRILDMDNCEDGANCLLIVSTIKVVLEDGDSVAAVSYLLKAGIKDSFGDGSFYGAVSSDTVVCP